MDLDKKQQILIYKIILCIISWISIGLLFRGIFSANPLVSLGWTVSTYTFQSNFLVFLWITSDVIYELLKKEKPAFLGAITHGAITLYITVTLIIFAIILQPLAGIEGMFEIGNMLYHYIVPILTIGLWVLTQKDEEYEKKMALYWLIYPLFIYLAYSMIIELVTGQYIYFFISLNLLGAFVIVTVALLTMLFYLLGRLYIFANGKLHAKKNK
jgi:hypothetical protein